MMRSEPQDPITRCHFRCRAISTGARSLQRLWKLGTKHVEGKDADYQNVISTELPEEMSWAWKKVYLEGCLAIGFFPMSVTAIMPELLRILL